MERGCASSSEPLEAVARRLAVFAGCRVELAEAGPHDGSAAVPTTVLRWWDGPTTAHMRILITEFTTTQPITTGHPRCFEHRMTSWGRALAVLLWLHASPGRIELHETQQAAEEIAYPDSCAPLWQQRASALLNLGPGGREFSLTAVRLLLQCARNESWNHAQQWLDSLGSNPRACLRIVR